MNFLRKTLYKLQLDLFGNQLDPLGIVRIIKHILFVSRANKFIGLYRLGNLEFSIPCYARSFIKKHSKLTMQLCPNNRINQNIYVVGSTAVKLHTIFMSVFYSFENTFCVRIVNGTNNTNFSRPRLLCPPICRHLFRFVCVYGLLPLFFLSQEL